MNVEQATRIVTDDVREMAQQSMNQAMMLRQGDPLEVALVIAVQELLNRGVIQEPPEVKPNTTVYACSNPEHSMFRYCPSPNACAHDYRMTLAK